MERDDSRSRLEKPAGRRKFRGGDLLARNSNRWMTDMTNKSEFRDIAAGGNAFGCDYVFQVNESALL